MDFGLDLDCQVRRHDLGSLFHGSSIRFDHQVVHGYSLVPAFSNMTTRTRLDFVLGIEIHIFFIGGHASADECGSRFFIYAKINFQKLVLCHLASFECGRCLGWLDHFVTFLYPIASSSFSDDPGKLFGDAIVTIIT